MRGKSPQSSTILSLTISGFLECSPLGSKRTLETKLLAIGGLPFIPIKQHSQLDFV